MPFVEEIRVEQYPGTPWLVPRAFSRRDLRYFSAFANVQALTVDSLEIGRFIPGVERYFGHFSPRYDPSRCRSRSVLLDSCHISSLSSQA
jgi:hypothetical protein